MGIQWDDGQSIKQSIFPGGEIFIRLCGDYLTGENVIIVTRLNTSDDIMELIMATDAIRRMKPKSISVYFPYLPYARQDRVCTGGEAFSLKVFGNLLNTQGYKEVRVLDAHSYVAGACIDNLAVDRNTILVGTAIQYHHNKNGGFAGETILVSPDAGALHKIHDIAQWCKFTDLAVGEKVRDLKTGNVIRTDVNRQDFEGKDCWIVDDICDGGRTFIELAKVLKERNAGKVMLFVTHGIFSKGFEPLAEHFNHVYFTNSIKDLPLVETVVGDCTFTQIEIKN